MKSKQIILIATGRGKADAIDGLVNGDITPSCPASVLQLHPNVHIFLDKAAASLL
jgi:glucosamine-6-phosphate deaminase